MITHNTLKTLHHSLYFTIYGIVKYIPSPIGDLLRFGILKLTSMMKDGQPN